MPTATQVLIEETQDEYIVLFGKKLLFKIKKDDRLSMKVAIISMANSGLVKQTDLAKAFHLHRDTIANYLKAYEKLGLASLADHRTGPRGISEEIEMRVAELLSTSTRKVDIPKIIFQEFGEPISRTKVYEIRKEYGSKPQRLQQKEANEKKK